MSYQHWHIFVGALLAFILGGLIAKFTGFGLVKAYGKDTTMKENFGVALAVLLALLVWNLFLKGILAGTGLIVA